MTPWLIFGAGGTGVGALTAELALAQKRPLVALVRNAQAAEKLSAAGAKTILGDARDRQAVAAACALASTAATLISTMGGAHNYLAHRTLIDAAESAGVARMIMVTSLGCGDTWRFLSPRARAGFGQAVREKSLAEIWLQTSSLDFAILRPSGLLNGTATGLAQRFQNQEVHGMVRRADVAQHIGELAQLACLGQQIYSLVQPGLKPD